MKRRLDGADDMRKGVIGRDRPLTDRNPTPIQGSVPLAVYLDLQAKYDALVQQMLQMKREGFDPPSEPGPALDAPADNLPGIVREAVEQRAVDTPSRRLLEQFAARELRRNQSPEDVAVAVLAGESLEE